MAWPFTTVNAPNLDTGPGQAVPTSATAITGAAAWLLGAHFTNPSGSALTATVTDTAGEILLQLEIPPGGEQPFEWPFRPTTGVKWSASGAGLLGQIWGYT
jgi:hypothetical protein